MNDNYDHLLPMVITESREVTGGLELSREQAAAYARLCLAGREDIARPAMWLRARIRNHPEEIFAIAAGTEPPKASPAGRRPSSRTVEEALGPVVYARRVEQVRAYCAEDERRMAAGLPFQWQERETRLRALAAGQAEGSRRHADATRPVETIPLPDDVPADPGDEGELPPEGSDEPPF